MASSALSRSPGVSQAAVFSDLPQLPGSFHVHINQERLGVLEGYPLGGPPCNSGTRGVEQYPYIVLIIPDSGGSS